VFVLHLYDRALLNRAALRAVGYDRNTPAPPGGEIVRDADGNPTGMLIARPNAMILYATLAKGPALPQDLQVNSTRQFMRELNRLGVTSAIDAGGGFQNYPEDYAVIEELAREDQLTIRIAYNLFTQNKGKELGDFERWTGMVKPGEGSDWYRHNGAGEMLVFSAADFEDFLQPRPDLPSGMEDELEKVVRHLVQQRWPFRLHATYDESITRMLDVFEKVDRDIPFDGLPWFFDHAETITPRNIERVKALGGGIAIQHRMAFQGEFFVERYGAEAAKATPPVAHAGDGRAGGRRHRRHPGRQLQPLDRPVLAGVGTDRRRPAPVRRRAAPVARYRARALDQRQRLVFQRKRQERPDPRRHAGRSGGAVRRFFPRRRRRHQGHRIGADDRRRQDRPWPGRIHAAGAAADSGAARMVAGARVRRPLPQCRAAPGGKPAAPVPGRLRRAWARTRPRTQIQRAGIRFFGFWGAFGCSCFAF
jgi:hypothetical protein